MNDKTTLIRQIHPSFVQNGKITSQAFRPTPKDQNRLSVYNGDMIECEKAYRHYTEELKLQSTGATTILYQECLSQDLKVYPDPAPFPEHVLIDFSGFSNKRKNTISKYLRNRAEARGWCFHI